MKQLNFKISFPELIIGSCLLVIFVSFIIGLVRNIDFFQNNHGIKLNFINGIQWLFYSNGFIRPILLIIAITGYFMHNKLGWILINNLFYFLIFSWFYPNVTYAGYIPVHYLIFALPLFLIILNNTSKIRSNYKIDKKQLVLTNLISIGIGIVLVLFKGFFHSNFQKEMWEIVEFIE